MVDIELVKLFFIGVMFSIANTVFTFVDTEKYENKPVKYLIAMAISKSFLGGAIAVVFFYGIGIIFPDWSVNLRVGVSASGAYLTDYVLLFLLSYLGHNKKSINSSTTYNNRRTKYDIEGDK